MTAQLNYVATWRPPTTRPETSYANNALATAISFEAVPTMNLVVYRIGYCLRWQ